jgi:hypothetical protein
MRGLKTLTALPDGKTYRTYGFAVKEDWITGSRIHMIFNFSFDSAEGQELKRYSYKRNQLFKFQCGSQCYFGYHLSVMLITGNQSMAINMPILNELEACQKLEEYYENGSKNQHEFGS